MEFRKTRKRQYQIEGLERRETPTAMGPAQVAAQAIHAAAVTQVFKGSGIQTITKQAPLSNKGLYTIGTIRAPTVLGNFVGISATVFTPGLKSFRSATVLQASDGSRITLVIASNSGAVTSAKGTFTITGGTGRFAHASGSGAISGNLNLAKATLTFNFQGIYHHA